MKANVTGVYSHFISSSQSANGGSNSANGTSPGGSAPNGSMIPSGSMGMPSGSMTGRPGGSMGGAVPTGSAGGSETGSGSNVYGAATPQDNSTFLRGWQLTDENGIPIQETKLITGVVKIETIYPGWYSGRALHIHLNVFIPKTIYPNGTYATDADNIHTGQLFFNVIFCPSQDLQIGNFDARYWQVLPVHTEYC